MRAPALLLPLALLAAAPVMPDSGRDYLQAVEFPYYLYPRQLWERELVWLKTIGIGTVEFSIPWNWHEPEPGKYDFTGAGSPRRDLLGFLRILRRLEMQAWVRPLPPVKGWINGGYPAWAGQDRRAQRRWLEQVGRALAPQVAAHGGPISFVEGAAGTLEAPAPPAPVTTLSANDSGALARSRHAFALGRGSLLWEEVEDALYPQGWEAAGGPVFRKGGVSLNGDERPTVSALRRDAALLRNWAALVGPLREQPIATKLPRGVSAVQLLPRIPGQASAVSVVNGSETPFQGELRVRDTAGQRTMTIPAVEVAPGDALWLPVDIPLAGVGLCKDCSMFAKGEYVVYATAELQTVEFENGILAMEFAAPHAGEVVLQLSREPSGPYLAAGKPTDFDWDEKTQRARLPVPAGKGAGSRVRVGLAIEAPEMSAFFADANRLIIGRQNVISTSYSSEQVAARSRLRLPEGYTAKPVPKSPAEIDYQVEVPADALHGSWANLALEADGMLLGRARLQLFRPLSARLADPLKLHFGAESELVVDPAVAVLDPKAGRNLDVILRNNSTQIQNYVVEASGEGWEFMPAKSEISIGPVMERTVALRAFGKDAPGVVHAARLRISGGAQMEIPLRIVSLARGHTAAYSLDLDGDGAPEWVLESQKARAVFSTQDGGRWREFVWKDTGVNVLPENGGLAGAGPVTVKESGGGLEFSGKGWKRVVRLEEARLTVEQNTALGAETLRPEKREGVVLEVAREGANRAVYSLGLLH